MPLPKPNNGESKDDFIDRCMSDDTMKEEYPDEDQRYAVCNSQWGKKSDRAMEYRTFDMELRIERAENEKTKPKIIGHAAVFDKIGDGGWFREKIARGAFTESIKQDDVRMLFNHNPDYVLGRNKAGTLQLREDEEGLYVENTPPDTQFAKDLMTSISRGDISQMSFGFEIIKESRQVPEDKNESAIFTLEEVRLWDVSPVTFPFYQQTDVSVHSRTAWAEAARQGSVDPCLKIKRKRHELEYKFRKATK